MARTAIGQAVVTDPSSGRASGYVLVAASPSVRPEDARHLTAAPQVTDYLHLEKAPGPYFSFYRLPSGSWAAVKRFVRGTRRGAFHRVVVHTLVLSAKALAELAYEPWLLWTRCRFRPLGGGAEMTPSALTDHVGEPGLATLGDLEAVTDGEPPAERAALLERRHDFLRERWGEDELGEKLRAVLAALAGGRRALLAQGAETEQLLAVAWSLLPTGDRLETPWTTHLAPAAGNLFHLACCPDPKALAGRQGDSERWTLPLVEPVPDDAGEDGRTLARALLEREIDLRELEEGFRRHEIRLSTSGQTRRWIVWLRTGEGLFTSRISDGAGASAEELARSFHELRLRPQETRSDPWLSPAHLLSLACGTVARMHREGRSVDDSLRETLRVLADTHWHRALLTPEVVSELAALVPRDTAPETVPVAAALVARTLAEPPGGTKEREALLGLLLAAPPPPSPEKHPLLVSVLLDLAIDLAETDLGPEASRRLSAWVAKLRISQAEARERFGAVLDSVRHAIARNRLNEAHPALVEAASSGADAHPDKTVAVLARLSELPSPDFLGWAPRVARLAGELEPTASGAASSVRGNYWRALVSRRERGRPLPEAALEMLPGLSGDDRRTVADLWLPEIARLEKEEVSKKLITALGSLVDPESADQRFQYNVGRLGLAMKLGDLGLVEAVSQAGRLLRATSSNGSFMKRALQKLLPPDPAPRAAAVVELLLSPAILPSSKRVIETELCEASLKRAGRALPGVLPSVAELAARGSLLLRVAAQLGGHWRHYPSAAEEFLREAGRIGRYDAIAAFLQASDASFLERTAIEGDASLVRKMTRALGEHVLARVYLRPYQAALRHGLGVAARRRVLT